MSAGREPRLLEGEDVRPDGEPEPPRGAREHRAAAEADLQARVAAEASEGLPEQVRVLRRQVPGPFYWERQETAWDTLSGYSWSSRLDITLYSSGVSTCVTFWVW